MIIVNSIKELREILKKERLLDKKIGFVPTMGFLHEGHLSLVKRAKAENEVAVMSIFVNPTQFEPGSDFEAYPRDLDRDSKLAESAGIDIIFAPTVEEMYPEGYSTYVEVEGSITEKLCGAKRPGHFKGVTSVVSKLFNIVNPDNAYFGQKDAQQVAVLEKMVRDMNIDINLIPCPIVREKDGLAMSSRNIYLSEIERKEALVLSKSLFEAKNMIENGEKSAKTIYDFLYSNIDAKETSKIDYIEIVSAKTLESVDKLEGDILIALAVYFGKARLIDNIRMEI